jgi:hypothetical protein
LRLLTAILDPSGRGEVLLAAVEGSAARSRRRRGRLIRLEAFIPMRAPIAAGHSVVHVGNCRLEAGGWYLIRHPTGRYELRQVGAPPGRALVAIRSIRVSPFPQDGQAVYLRRRMSFVLLILFPQRASPGL